MSQYQAWVNARRQQALGISHYVWRTREDARVRAGHRKHDDQVFAWDKETPHGHPGHDFGCRCVAEPVVEGKEGCRPRNAVARQILMDAAGATGTAEALWDAGVETIEGIGTVLSGVGATLDFAVLELAAALGLEGEENRARRQAIEAQIGEELANLPERLETLQAALAQTPELLSAFNDYVAAVENRVWFTLDAYLKCEATEAELAEAVRERAYLRTQIAMTVVPAAGAALSFLRGIAKSRLLREFIVDESGAVPLGRGFRAAAAARANLAATRNITRITGTGITRARGIREQGIPWEEALNRQGGYGRWFGPRPFPVIDFFDPVTRVATSAKTLNINAPTYVNRPQAIFYTLKRYLDKLKDFEGDRFEEVTKIEHRQLRLAIPEGATDEQLKEIIYAMEYAQSLEVDMNWVVAQ
ncbi:phage minor head protein [Aliiroseovarius sp.]|uniref:endonuclease toxin domain-containing protein n=1 Tax=Aliiroseovarius sp. TaxID=1872442 RepID=UPI003BAC7F46